MKIDYRTEGPADEFETLLRRGLDRIAAGTPTSTPRAFDPDAPNLVSLDRPESRRWTPYLVTAAAATIAIVGLATIQRQSAPPSQQPAATAPDATSTFTTTAESTPPIIPVGSVVCLDAGAGEQAVALCADELGGLTVEATNVSDDSFVMPVDPTNPAHVSQTAVASEALNLPARALDARLLPAESEAPAEAMTYLVLGLNNPYMPDSSVAVDTTVPHACENVSGEVSVPNVAGMPYSEAGDVLASAGLTPNALRELPPSGLAATDVDYAVIRQSIVPGTTAPCGTVIDVTAAYRPGILYVVQEGDSYESIAAAQGIPLEQLLSFSGLTIAELDAIGQGPTAPLLLGQAVPLSIHPATLNTVPTTTP